MYFPADVLWGKGQDERLLKKNCPNFWYKQIKQSKPYMHIKPTLQQKLINLANKIVKGDQEKPYSLAAGFYR